MLPLKCAFLLFLSLIQITYGSVVPVDGMKINSSMIFAPGIYQMELGITIVADNVVLDMGKAMLLGINNTGVAISATHLKNVTIMNGVVSGFYYGAKFVDCHDLNLFNLSLVNNWRDPTAFNSTPVWLNINVTPDNFGDTTNLGGGLWLENCTHVQVLDSKFTGQENGIDAWRVTHSLISGCDASFNVGWGFHFWKSHHNTISYNKADYCTRGPGHYTCDTAGLLLNCECHHNNIIHNSFRFSGDGVFMSGFPREQQNECCPSNSNFFYDNDCSYSPNNAFESTFAHSNVFVRNVVTGSNYGFWLGYSYNNTVSLNSIDECVTAGIAVEHGQNNVFENNTFNNNGVGIQLWTDDIIHFPANQFGCLDLPNPRWSDSYRIDGNYFMTYAPAIQLINTTRSLIFNNIIQGTVSDSIDEISNLGPNAYNLASPYQGENIIGGPDLGGNSWLSYAGNCSADGFGSTPFKLPSMSVADNYPLCKQG